jgi:hypothetical protein
MISSPVLLTATNTKPGIWVVGEEVAASIAGRKIIRIWNNLRLTIMELLKRKGEGTFSDFGCARLLYCVCRHREEVILNSTDFNGRYLKGIIVQDINYSPERQDNKFFHVSYINCNLSCLNN